MNCRFCNAPLEHTFVDLGVQPLANSYVSSEGLGAMEAFYPLHVRVCAECFLVQLPEFEAPERIFTHYAYLSGTSSSWRAHCRAFADTVSARFSLTTRDRVIEIASNDGCLLKNFVERGHPVLGIEPAANVAAMAEESGVRTLARFMSTELADELVADGVQARLLVANNVLAHVPDINDFVRGLRRLLAAGGVLSVEFPHLLRLIESNQFDTIYHEHFSYLSLLVVSRVFARHGLRVFDVTELGTHGGSLRVFGCRDDDERAVEPGVAAVLERERAFGLDTLACYAGFANRVYEAKFALLEFLIAQRRAGKRVVGYGAPAKGNTLLNLCGIRADLLEFTVDRNPLKVGTYLPGTRIPVRDVSAIDTAKPDFVLILPWNIQSEVTQQMQHIGAWGGRFVVPIPKVSVL